MTRRPPPRLSHPVFRESFGVYSTHTTCRAEWERHSPLHRRPPVLHETLDWPRRSCWCFTDQACSDSHTRAQRRLGARHFQFTTERTRVRVRATVTNKRYSKKALSSFLLFFSRRRRLQSTHGSRTRTLQQERYKIKPLVCLLAFTITTTTTTTARSFIRRVFVSSLGVHESEVLSFSSFESFLYHNERAV